MGIFIAVVAKLIPLYLIILPGYLAGRYLHVKKEAVSSLLMYVIYPVVVFAAATNITINFSTLTLPLLVFTIACVLCLLFYLFASTIWMDTTKNLVAFGAGNANTAYFGIPVALALFGEDMIGLYILCAMGITFYENTLGFFISARGHHTPKESLLKLVKLPTLYALVFGLIFNFLNIELSPLYMGIADSFRATVVVLGMMIIGLGLSKIKDCVLDFKLIGMTFVAKFLAWPLCIVTAILVDKYFLHLYNHTAYEVLLLIALLPLGANVVVFATELKTEPEKASFAVLASTVFALVYIPAAAVLFL